MPHGRDLPATCAVPIPTAALAAGTPDAPTGTSSSTFTTAAAVAAAALTTSSATALTHATTVPAAWLAASTFTAAAVGGAGKPASTSASTRAGLHVDRRGLLRRLRLHVAV
tara:strand:+ start:1259 stop:1591 length:333 start_codon:yes stop_codon:yes gene_type:complete